VCSEDAAVRENRGLEVAMATTPHIWLPWWQTSMHLQSRADLRTFLTGWRKATTMESCLFQKLANEEPVLGATCAMSLCQRVILHVKGEGPLNKDRVRPL